MDGVRVNEPFEAVSLAPRIGSMRVPRHSRTRRGSDLLRTVLAGKVSLHWRSSRELVSSQAIFCGIAYETTSRRNSCGGFSDRA